VCFVVQLFSFDGQDIFCPKLFNMDQRALSFAEDQVLER
jgi:hypothetical protein